MLSGILICKLQAKSKIQRYVSHTIIIVMVKLLVVYHKRGKIRWAKHSQFQPYGVFQGNTFVVPWPAVFII